MKCIVIETKISDVLLKYNIEVAQLATKNFNILVCRVNKKDLLTFLLLKNRFTNTEWCSLFPLKEEISTEEIIKYTSREKHRKKQCSLQNMVYFSPGGITSKSSTFISKSAPGCKANEKIKQI